MALGRAVVILGFEEHVSLNGVSGIINREAREDGRVGVQLLRPGEQPKSIWVHQHNLRPVAFGSVEGHIQEGHLNEVWVQQSNPQAFSRSDGYMQIQVQPKAPISLSWYALFGTNPRCYSREGPLCEEEADYLADYFDTYRTFWLNRGEKKLRDVCRFLSCKPPSVNDIFPQSGVQVRLREAHPLGDVEKHLELPRSGDGGIKTLFLWPSAPHTGIPGIREAAKRYLIAASLTNAMPKEYGNGLAYHRPTNFLFVNADPLVAALRCPTATLAAILSKNNDGTFTASTLAGEERTYEGQCTLEDVLSDGFAPVFFGAFGGHEAWRVQGRTLQDMYEKLSAA